MSELVYIFGTVGSGKTAELLMKAHNYEASGKSVVVIAPSLDDRHGVGVVRTRINLSRKADLVVDDLLDLSRIPEKTDLVLVDEVQFFSKGAIEQLREIATRGTPVHCYGLRTDFRTQLFPAITRLMAVADEIRETPTVCRMCSQKAIYNLKMVNGAATTEGQQVDIGGDEKYIPVCAGHYRSMVSLR